MTVPQTTIEHAIRTTRSARADARSLTNLSGARLSVAIGIFLAALGVTLLGGGVWLAAHGGPWHYVVAGALLFATGHLLARRRTQ
jgi:hypothetical protein